MVLFHYRQRPLPQEHDAHPRQHDGVRQMKHLDPGTIALNTAFLALMLWGFIQILKVAPTMTLLTP